VHSFGTSAYAVSPTGAAKILDFCFPLSNRSVTVDCLGRTFPAYSIDCLLNHFYGDNLCFAAFPPLAITPHDKTQSDTAKQAGN